jgi:hypothetical protein
MESWYRQPMSTWVSENIMQRGQGYTLRLPHLMHTAMAFTSAPHALQKVSGIPKLFAPALS